MKFNPPTIEEAKAYADSIGFKTFNADKWWHFYNAKDWMVGRNKMSKWKSAIQTWFIGSADWQALKTKKKKEPKPETVVELATPEQRAAIRKKLAPFTYKIKHRKGSFEDVRQQELKKLRRLK